MLSLHTGDKYLNLSSKFLAISCTKQAHESVCIQIFRDLKNSAGADQTNLVRRKYRLLRPRNATWSRRGLNQWDKLTEEKNHLGHELDVSPNCAFYTDIQTLRCHDLKWEKAIFSEVAKVFNPNDRISVAHASYCISVRPARTIVYRGFRILVVQLEARC
jgi:hypothetical protein